jgi:hypothetical protein
LPSDSHDTSFWLHPEICRLGILSSPLAAKQQPPPPPPPLQLQAHQPTSFIIIETMSKLNQH